MPAVPSDAGSGPVSAPPRGLRLRGFSALRFDPARVDLAAVTCPPYDVIERAGVAVLEAQDPHNVVRLILPRGAGEGRYSHAVDLLEGWQRDGVLRRDDAAAVYVYEQFGKGLLQRGLLGALELRDPEERVVLPHEDVMPGPVADRFALMRATKANLEPILLVYDGGGAAGEVVERVADRPPLAEALTVDGMRHRLWRLDDPVDLEVVAGDLGPRQAMIADGHHRYASYLRLQEHFGASRGPGPWDAGLALLVDSARYPLRVRAIHRVVAGLASDEAATLAAKAFTVTPLEGPEAGLALLDDDGGRHRFVLHGAAGTWLAEDPDATRLEAALDPGRPARWRRLDAAVLHGLLIEALWGISDESALGYHHDATGAIDAAIEERGTAVLMRPAPLADVLALAALGERMPRKSTSFGPKPRTGIVLRELRD